MGGGLEGRHGRAEPHPPRPTYQTPRTTRGRAASSAASSSGPDIRRAGRRRRRPPGLLARPALREVLSGPGVRRSQAARWLRQVSPPPGPEPENERSSLASLRRPSPPDAPARAVDVPALGSLATVLDNMATNERFVATVRRRSSGRRHLRRRRGRRSARRRRRSRRSPERGSPAAHRAGRPSTRRRGRWPRRHRG